VRKSRVPMDQDLEVKRLQIAMQNTNFLSEWSTFKNVLRQNRFYFNV